MSKSTEEALQAQVDLLQRLYEQGLLAQQDYRAQLASLGVDPITIFDQREQRVKQQINVEGDYVVRQVESGPLALDGDTALDRYLHHVVEANRRLRLQGIRSSSGLVSIDLEEIYVTLTITDQRAVAAEESLGKEMASMASGKVGEWMGRLSVDQSSGMTAQAQTKVKVQNALAAHPRLVVLGNPGCGKTTLLRYLALTFARALSGEDGLVEQRLQLKIKVRQEELDGSLRERIRLSKYVEQEEQRLPILLPLRDFGSYLVERYSDSSIDGPRLLLEYLRTYFANQDILLPERFFADRLQHGECAVLLDGVDEVADFGMRHRVARIIERFTVAYPNNRYVVTSRVVGYTGSSRLSEGYAVTTVRDFSQADIERFVTYWNHAVEVCLAGGETPYVLTQTQRQTETLLQAIKKNERIRELAVNPLLLTVIALVQRYRAQLPERRTELYEEAIEVLLGKWDEAKGMKTKTPVADLELDAGDRRGLLEPLALWMMEQKAREIEVDELERQLEQRFFEMVGNRRRASKAVDAFLHLINERSGLLAERGQGVYAFSHLTFQEHLAARAVADMADYVAYTIERLSDSWWREVILLEAGYLSTQGKRRVTVLVRSIMEFEEESTLYHNLVLAAEALHDVGVVRVEGDLPGEVQRRIRRELEQPLRGVGKDMIARRVIAAEALARIEISGSSIQPAFWHLPHGEPVWVDVPAGEFWMGGEGKYDGKPVHRVHLERFQIARVPITNIQYLFFVEAVGHTSPRHWMDGRPPRGLESHPVVHVSWSDAIAYCHWLSKVTGKPIALPSEARWEKAARGDRDKREYPWGSGWSGTRCNTGELKLKSTTPVGIFSDSASPYGCLDMAGQVWEWTQSRFEEYPYNSSDGREDLKDEGSVYRVLRGGAFYRYCVHARCAFRNWGKSDDAQVGRGFRVIVSHVPS